MKRSFPVCFFLLAFSAVHSQNIMFNKVVPPLGNFSGLVSGVTQDKNGYIWIATNRDGLYKYDGYRFQAFTSDYSGKNSLSSNSLETVYADRDGMLWILTYVNGVDRFDPASARFTHFQHNPADTRSLSSDTTRAVLQDHEGTVWIGTNKGLDRYDRKTNTFKHYRHNPADSNSLSCNQVRKLYEDRKGTLWIGTGSIWVGEGGESDEGGLNRFDDRTGTFVSYRHNTANPRTLINNKVQAILEDSRGTFWVGTAGDGLHTMDRKLGTFERHTYDPSHPEKLSRPPLGRGNFPDHITAIAEDASGSVWISTLLNGINRYNPKTRETAHFGKGDSTTGFPDNTGWSFFNSNDGILWLSTWEGNLFRIDPYQDGITHMPLTAGVTALCEDNDNNLWMGTTQGLVVQNRRTGSTVKYANKPANANSITNNSLSIVTYDGVGALCKDQEGTIWIGTPNGLTRFNAASRTFTRFQHNPEDPGSISPGFVRSITEAGNGDIWIGTDFTGYNASGLSLLNKRTGTFTNFKRNPADSGSISRDFISSILVDQRENVWVGTYLNGGLNYLERKTGKFRHFLKNITVFSLLKDTYGTLWVGTDAGLFQSANSTQRFVPFTDPGSRIEKMTVLSIREDDQKNLWISTQMGICKIDLRTRKVTFFGMSHGVGKGFYQGSSYKERSGNIYFGNRSGYYVLSPAKITGNPHPPGIVFTEFRLSGNEVLAKDSGLATGFRESPNGLSLNYNQNVFSIGLAALHFSSPENNRILYKLQNYDHNWRDAGSDKTASYFNVPPGHYVLKVKAASSEGVWAEKELPITIAPPWWRSWWAYCFYGLLLLSAIYLIDRFQRKRLIAGERERTRERELGQAKEIEKAYNELKRTQAQLIQSEKMASLGELTAGIAHEIQNPLNFVNNFSETNAELLDELLQANKTGNPAEVEELANSLKENEQRISHHGKRADSIVKGMLHHARQSTGNKEPTDINQLADEYLRLSYQGMRAKDKNFNAAIETSFDEAVGPVTVVPQEVGRVLLNLFNNAFYAVQQKKQQLNGIFDPRVEVSTKQGSKDITITVKDNGTGMPTKTKNKVFQPFFTTKPTGEGTGLGLSLSYDIVTKGHGGTLTVQSTAGEGSEFVVTLPVT